MKRSALALASAAVLVLAISSAAPGLASAATNDQKVTAIDNGLGYLYGQQQAGGYWNYGGYEQAATAASVSAFVSQQSHWGANAGNYQAAVDKGMKYLLNSATVDTVGMRNDGRSPCSGGASGCTGIYWYGSGEATYTTGLVATAIGQYAAGHSAEVATTTGPLAGMTWTQIAQGVTNEFVAGQSTINNGDRRGGWRYFPGSGDSDSSTTQWAVLSMIYDQSLGATTPGYVKSELGYWLNAASAGAGGAGCYQPYSGLCEQSDTGSLLLGLNFMGLSPGNTQVDAAIGWLNTHWTETANNTWYGDFGHPYAMWSDYKALELQIGKDNAGGISNLAGCGTLSAGTTCNWWQDYNQWLVSNQNGDGSWSGYSYWTGPLATAWNVSILGGTEVPPVNGGIPEPATWAMLIVGFFGLGGVLRAKRRRACAIA
jgi:hypothetical protein